MAKKLVTPAQKQTAAAAKAEIAKAKLAATLPQPTPKQLAALVSTGQQIVADAKASKAKAPKPAKDPKPAKAPKPPKPAPARRPEGMPDHWTLSGNKKHQCNGPQSWSAVFLAAAKAVALPGAQVREGDGVRIALAIGVAELAKRHGVKLATPAADPKQTSHPAVAK